LSESRIERRERERREEAFREEARRDEARRAETKRARVRAKAREYEYELEREQKRRRKRDTVRKKRRRNAGGAIALILILLVAFTVGRIWWETRSGGSDPIVMPGADEFDDSERINILFLGTNQGLSDTMMVFSLDSANKRLDQISVPRDTYYYRPSYAGAAYHKVNSIYSTDGYEGVCKAVSDILGGIPIHYYAVLEPEGVKKIVDAMGGVVMDVPMDMHYSDPDQNLYIDLRAGPQMLNGDQAMQYLRFRSGYANGDLGRVSAQQEFLNAVMTQSAGLDFAKVALAASNVTKTNMNLTTQAGFATRAASIRGGMFYTHTIPGGAGMQDGLSYFFHDAAATKAMMDEIYASA